jgi:flagellar biogenesis protein FliO
MEIMDPMPAVLAVLGVLAAALWWLRKKGAVRLLSKTIQRPARRLASIERLALSPHHVLHLVRLDDRTLLVAQSPAGLAPLDSVATESHAPVAAFRAAAAERG